MKTIHKYYRILSSLVHNITLFLHVPPIWWLYIYSLYISNNNKSIYTSCALCCLHMTIPYDDCHLWQWWHIFESPDWISNKVCCNFYETCTKKIHTIKCLSKSAHIEVIFEHLLSFIGTFDFEFDVYVLKSMSLRGWATSNTSKNETIVFKSLVGDEKKT